MTLSNIRRLRRRIAIAATFAGLCAFADYAVAADVSISPDAPPTANDFVPTPRVQRNGDAIGIPGGYLRFGGQRNADGDDIRPFTDEDLAKIEASQTVIALSFGYSDVDDADLERLAGNPRVRHITLRRCRTLPTPPSKFWRAFRTSKT